MDTFSALLMQTFDNSGICFAHDVFLVQMCFRNIKTLHTLLPFMTLKTRTHCAGCSTQHHCFRLYTRSADYSKFTL